MAKFNALERINALDPYKDYWEIVRLSSFYEFHWDFTRSLELALFRTFAVPSISAVLAKSMEFEKRPQKRYDDTDLILSEILENGLESERAQAAIKKMNFIHSHFNITNEQYLYVLTTFVFEPERWIAKYGYRKLTENELIAGVRVWHEVGAAMGIKDIPQTRAQMEKFNIEYEEKYFVPAESNKKIAGYTQSLFLGWFLPKPLHFLGRPFLHAIMDDRLLYAMGFSKPNAIISGLVSVSMQVRKFVLRLLPRRTKPFLRTPLPRRESYPNGYEVSELGSMKYR